MRAIPTLAALLALSVACGGGSPTSPSFGSPTLTPVTVSSVRLTRGTVSATIDGARWESTTASGITSGFTGGIVYISGTGLGSASVLNITTRLAPGTYTIGGSPSVGCHFSESFALQWSASLWHSGSSCTVTVTAATPTRVAGTFAFTAVAAIPGSTLTPATRTVTNGAFDVFQ